MSEEQPPATEQWGMRWEVVPDTADGGADRASDVSRRRKVRALVGACVLGAVLIVVIVGFAVTSVLHEVDRHRGDDPATIKTRYAQQFRACIATNRAPASCNETVERRCEADPRWGSGTDVSVRSRYCVFLP